MLEVLAKTWWAVLFRGLLLLLLGAAALIWPGMTFFALIYVFAFFAVGEGIFSLLGLAGRWGRGPWWAQLAGGLLSLAAGGIAFVLPGLTAVVLLYLIAGWAVARGIMDIITAIALRQEISNEWFLIFAGVVSTAFGVLLVLQPGSGLLALLWLLGVFGVVAGVMLVALALRLRGVAARQAQAS